MPRCFLSASSTCARTHARHPPAAAAAAAAGNHDARTEVLTRNIMAVDNVDWHTAKETTMEIQACAQSGNWLGRLPYQFGFVLATTAGIASIPLCFHLDTVLAFNEACVSHTLSPPFPSLPLSLRHGVPCVLLCRRPPPASAPWTADLRARVVPKVASAHLLPPRYAPPHARPPPLRACVTGCAACPPRSHGIAAAVHTRAHAHTRFLPLIPLLVAIRGRRYVTCDPPEEGDVDTWLEVGSYAWNWMEPPLGQASFGIVTQ